ncbi:hypothetical protein ACJ7V3_15015 [Halomonas elongata]|uniref:hypothetical protein n=1 Tax=Halomonas elongata TaxID=2746 RepID=UPI0038D41BDB
MERVNPERWGEVMRKVGVAFKAVVVFSFWGVMPLESVQSSSKHVVKGVYHNIDYDADERISKDEAFHLFEGYHKNVELVSDIEYMSAEGMGNAEGKAIPAVVVGMGGGAVISGTSYLVSSAGDFSAKGLATAIASGAVTGGVAVNPASWLRAGVMGGGTALSCTSCMVPGSSGQGHHGISRGHPANVRE